MYKEYTRPLEQQIDTDKNIFSVLEERVNRTPNDSLVEYKNEHGEWASFSATEFRDKVIAIAKGLIAQGIMPGDSVSIISHTCWQWTALDVAIMSIGALTVPVYETNSPAQVKMIFNDANVKMAFAEDDAQRDKIESIRSECSNLGDIYVIGLDAIDTMVEYGHAVSDAEFQEREHAVKGSDLATIVYTSGSTGTPKGIELTHSNFVFITYSGINSMPDIAMKPNRRLLLFLPLAHVFARYMQFFCFAGNVSLGLSGNLKTILADFKAFKPTFILAVPRIFEKIYNAASQKAGDGLKGRIFAGATQTARGWSHAQQSGEGIPVVLNLKHALYNKLVYSSIMDVFGGHVEYAVSGGAPLDSSIAHFFNGIGLPLLEGYGMTETCAPSSVNPTSGYKIGTIGLPLQGVTMGVDEEGELCIKSPAVCAGYHNNPDVTKQQIVNGWLHTGDLGSIDDEGFVSIVGRKKDLIITAGGKNVSPGPIEDVIKRCEFVSQALVLGDKRPFISALITLDEEALRPWLESKGLNRDMSMEEASSNAAVRAEVQKWVDQANEGVSRAESVRKFIILPEEFTQENGLMTASMKVIRPKVIKRYATLLNTQMYTKKK